MRFLLFDRVTKLVPGKRIEGVKCFTLSEEHHRGHLPRRPTVPGPLLVEAMVQLLGWCVIARHDFRLSVVLSVIEDVDLPGALAPGQRVDLFGELLGTQAKGSMGRAWAEIDGERIASAGRVLYAHVPQADPEMMRGRFRFYGGEP